ncbi:glycosyltransferase 87 family protein [Jatrophihabitans sp. GAS493]|uniref:glycosyltransferase 87 family protein n=1 Tax=Jatrophihabitans sp. GAS493 TaxID=1907575 RepID=UPI000BB7CAFA|nr:glycosyltransferase 87 family protein [Jatrophihabitans sp. GAS493]
MTSTLPGSATTHERRVSYRLLLVLALLGEAAMIAAISNPWHPAKASGVLSYEAAAAGFFLIGLLAFTRSRLSSRVAVWLIFAVAIGLNLLALLSGPTSSDDDFRYAWDAKVQLSGTDPYRYVPADPILLPERDAFTFPTDRPCRHRPVAADGCTQINRPDVHTIYPPVAQASFVGMRLLSFGGRGGHLPLQLTEALASLGVTLLLVRNARRRGRPLWSAAVWAWCPIAVLELANDAHIEGIAVLLSIAGVLASARGRDRAAALWVGAAIATKLYPALLLPALMRRRPGLVAGTAVGFVALSYVPHVLAVGREVIGYLPGYLQEGDYLDGGRFLLLNVVFPEAVSPYVAVLLLAAIAVAVWRRGDPQRPELGSLLMVGAFFLIATPDLSWYSLLLLALCALAVRPEWLGVVAAPTLIYLGVKLHWDPTVVGVWAYAAGGLLVAAVALGRHRSDRHGRGYEVPLLGQRVARFWQVDAR